MRKVLAATTGATVLVGVLAVSTAVAAPGSASPAATPSPPPPAPTAGPAVEGILDGGTRAKQDGISLKTRDDALVRTFTLTYPPLAESGWHQHPGIVLATVESGRVVQRVGCDRNVWKKGQSFTEVEAHLIRNPSKTTPAVLRITQIAPEDVPLRENVAPPRC